MYDFHKVRNEGTDSEYKNTQFIRGQQKLMCEIKRKSGENYMGEDQFSNNQQPSEGLIEGNGEGGGMHIPSNASINNNNNQSMKSDNDLNSNNTLQDNANMSGNSFLNDVVSFKAKQKDLEKAMTMLIKQHEALIKENKILWDEIRKQVEVDEKKSNQLIMVLAFYLSNFNASTHPNQSPMGMPSFASSSNNANPSNNMHANSNNNSSSNNNNNRTLSIPTINHKFQSSCEDFDLASFLQPQRYNMDEIQKLMQDTNSMRAASGAAGGGSYAQDNNLKNCSFGMPVYPLPLNKKPKGNNSASSTMPSGEFPSNVSNQQIQKLFESYSCGDKQSKEKIAAYLQGIINNTKNLEGNSRQQRMNNYSLPYEPPSPPLVHEKQSISVFENPSVKRICDQSDNPLLSTKMLPAPEPITTTTVANFMENNTSNHNNMSKAMMMIGNNEHIQNDTSLLQSRQLMDSFKNESAVFPSNEYLMNTLMNSSHVNTTSALNSNNNNGGTNNALDLLSLSRANSTNNFNGIPLFNDVKYFSDQQQMQSQSNPNNSSNKYSSSPLLSRDTENPNILHSPGYFAHGSFTPVHNYNAEDDGFFMGSRRNSFHLPENKQQESQMILTQNNQNNSTNNNNSNSQCNNNNNNNDNQFSSINS